MYMNIDPMFLRIIFHVTIARIKANLRLIATSTFQPQSHGILCVHKIL